MYRRLLEFTTMSRLLELVGVDMISVVVESIHNKIVSNVRENLYYSDGQVIKLPFEGRTMEK